MALRDQIIRKAQDLGADLVGIADAARFAAADGNIVQCLFPAARSVIGLGFRILRGSLRGVEEGTNYFQLEKTGPKFIEETVMPGIARRLAVFLEDCGFEASVQLAYPRIRPDDSIVPTVNHHELYLGKSAENALNFTDAAVLCGLGELGMSGHLLTDSFGPWQRCCFILTDAVLEPDPIQPRHLCDGCGECRKQCPGHYTFAPDTAVRKIGSQAYTVYSFNPWHCYIYYHGANRTKNPFLPPAAFPNIPDRLKVMSGSIDLDDQAVQQVVASLDELFDSCQGGMGMQRTLSICGFACDRACYIHLEEQDALSVKYVEQFRKQPDWFLSVD